MRVLITFTPLLCLSGNNLICTTAYQKTEGVVEASKLTYFSGEPILLSSITGPLFVSESTRNPGLPLAVGAFDEIIERVRAKVNLPALTPHTLRHQRCTILKRAGVGLDDIALIAGHKSTASTRLYIHLAPGELSKRIRVKVKPFDDPIRALVEQALGKAGSS